MNRWTLSTSAVVRVIPMLVVVALVNAVGPERSTEAYEFIVAKTADTADIFCTPGPPADPPYDCSLREAIWKANILPGKDYIYVPAGTYNLTRLGDDEDANSTGDLDIRDDVEIRGFVPGPVIIDGQGDDRVFDIRPPTGSDVGPTVTLQNLRIQNGRLKITNQDGAGVFSYKSMLSVLDCEIVDNTAVADNNWGAGVASREGSLYVRDSLLRENSATGLGGGVSQTNGMLLIVRSTFDQNYSNGGSVFFSWNSTTSILNSTAVDNITYGPDESGGILVQGSGSVSIDSCTFGNNWGDTIGAAGEPYVPITIRNTIIDGTCSTDAYVFTDGGNIEGPGNTCTFINPTDYYGLPVYLMALRDNGGSTPTALPMGLTVELGVDNAWADPTCLGDDQRGVLRPVDADGDGAAHCDTGAVELLPGDPFFADGFEDSSTLGWSVTNPPLLSR